MFLKVPAIINLILCVALYFLLLKLLNEPLFGEVLNTLGIRKRVAVAEAL
jgi:hypothetical protein